MRKGALEAIPGFLYIAIGIAVGLLMLFLTYKFLGGFTSNKNIINGDETKVAMKLAKIAEKCWKEHKMGLDSRSAICRTLKLNAQSMIYEKNITMFLNCNLLPNSDCYPDNCEFCSSERYEDSDRLDLYIETNECEIQITYSGNDRKIVIVKTDCDDTCKCLRECMKKCSEVNKACKKICSHQNTSPDINDLCLECKFNMEEECSTCVDICQS